MKFQIICMSFDGDYQREQPEFETIEDAWEYACDLGSKWYFYPFCFVVSCNTIRAASFPLEHWTIGRRIKTIARFFEAASKRPETQNMEADEFAFAV